MAVGPAAAALVALTMMPPAVKAADKLVALVRRTVAAEALS